jgi:hypothetical protein
LDVLAQHDEPRFGRGHILAVAHGVWRCGLGVDRPKGAKGTCDEERCFNPLTLAMILSLTPHIAYSHAATANAASCPTLSVTNWILCCVTEAGHFRRAQAGHFWRAPRTTPDGRRTINIQVKTRSIKNRAGWILTRKIETLMPGDNFYVAFVDLKGLGEEPDYYLIPRNEFSTWIAERHSQWLATPGRSGRAHVDNPIRAFDRPQFKHFEKYHNNWNI